MATVDTKDEGHEPGSRIALDALRQRFVAFGSVHFYGPTTSAAIDAAEQILGTRFSPQYRQFLANFGCGGIESEEFIGLGGPEHLDVVRVKQRLSSRRNSLPPHLIPIRADGAGNYDCLDTRQVSSDAEYAIVEWQHDGGAVDEFQILAPSYFEWMDSILRLVEGSR